MFDFILRRLLQSVIVMLTVSLVAFVIFTYVGDPLESLTSEETRLEEREAMRERLGLDEPAHVQFARYVARVAQGDFGISYRYQQPVTRLILERLPATLELAFASALIALAGGVLLGVWAALKPRSIGAHVVLVLSLVGVSLPTFVIGIGLIYVFAVRLGWFPSFGRGETVQIGGWKTGLLTASGWRSLVLPAITLSLFQLTMIMRLVRAEMLEVLRQDFICFARARGLSQRTIWFGHALKNTLVPVITITGLQLGSVIAFAIVTESVFQWPGVGSLFIQSVQGVDIPVMAAYLVFVAFVFVAINLIVDLLYFAVDPRLRAGRPGRSL
ncbi:ABC transporter permease [Paenirhodobacter sp.]|uniref:ABC transporter permease n=1 Tax=Paenirhodobacter sp. TaxID=1965326 RepID=UPI003B412C92